MPWASLAAPCATGYRLGQCVLEAPRAIYAPNLRGQHRDAQSIRLDVADGRNERQVLVIYGKDRPGAGVLFIMLPWTAEPVLDRTGREALYQPGEKDE